MPDRRRTVHLGVLFFAGCAALYTWLYYPVLAVGPRADDWLWVAEARRLVREWGTLTAMVKVLGTPVFHYWRPLAVVPVTICPETLFVSQFLKLLLVLGIALLLTRVARRLGASPALAWISGGLLLLHQNLVPLLAQPDYWADALVSLAVVALLACGLRYHAQQMSTAWYVAGVVLCSLAAMASKEAGVVTCLTPAVLGLLLPPASPRERRGHGAAALAALAVAAVYMLLRLATGLGLSPDPAGPEAFSLAHIGWNLTLTLLAQLSPVNTVCVALEGAHWRLLAGAFAVLLAALAAGGIALRVRSSTWRPIAVLAVLFFLNQGPALLLPHLSEGDTSRSLVAGTLLLTLALGTLWQRASFSGKTALTGVLLLWLVFDLSAVASKVRDVVREQAKAETFLREVVRQMPVLPARPLLFAGVIVPEPRYSIYRLPLVPTLAFEIPLALRDRYRNDNLEARYIIVDPSTPALGDSVDFLILPGDRVLRVPHPERTGP